MPETGSFYAQLLSFVRTTCSNTKPCQHNLSIQHAMSRAWMQTYHMQHMRIYHLQLKLLSMGVRVAGARQAARKGLHKL